MRTGKINLNANGRYELVGVELTSGDPLDLLIEGHWIRGHLEFWADAYYWFSRTDNIAVVLRSGLTARVSERR